MTGDDIPRSRTGPLFWLRWSWRDLREHWIAVVAIALVLAIGTGVYAGLRGTSDWRRLSNDASFAAGNMFDLRAAANPGEFLDEGELSAAVAEMPSADDVVLVTERLVVDSQVEVDTDDGRQLIRARVVGSGLDGEDVVGRVWVRDGTAPSPGSGEAVLEAKFADFHGLDPTGALTIAGGERVGWTALGIAPEDFFVVGPEGSIIAQADVATIYLDLDDTQDLIARQGQVNEVVIMLAPGADRDRVEQELSEAVAAVGAGGVIVTDQDEADAFRILYEDIENDQQFFTALAVLILFAAALAAFNLISRIVEAQRREIGIGMALGVPRGQLAIRPLLVGVQIALLGVVLGIGVGLLVGAAMKGLFESVLPLPVYRTPFPFDVYALAAALGLIVPIVASAWPVWRAVSVEPIEAIRTGHLSAKPGRFTRLSKRIRLPGSSMNQIPLRNVLRTPRRTALTAGGVGAAIAALVAVLGMLDSFERAIDRGSAEVTKGDSERVLVQLDTFHPTDGEVVEQVTAASEVRRVDATLIVPAMALDGGSDAFELSIEILDFESAAWSPSFDGPDAAPAGIVIAEKAADDLGVTTGETVIVEHPARSPDGALVITRSEFEVSGVHPNPIRNFAFLDAAYAEVFGFTGLTNQLHAYPAPGVSRTEMQAALFTLDGVGTTQAVARISEAFDEAMETFVGFLVITSAFVLVLALLIAFNATRITVEERRRDHATMRAFGLPVRSVMATVMKESVIVGVLATVVGVLAGTWVLGWMLQSLAERTLPDFGITRYLSPSTLVIAGLIGIAAVTIAPLFLVRRVAKMDLPATLRVME